MNIEQTTGVGTGPVVAPLPITINAAVGKRDLAQFLSAGREQIGGQLVEYGGILFRGFNVFDVAAFECAMDALNLPRMTYVSFQPADGGRGRGIYFNRIPAATIHRPAQRKCISASMALKDSFLLFDSGGRGRRDAGCERAERDGPYP